MFKKLIAFIGVLLVSTPIFAADLVLKKNENGQIFPVQDTLGLLSSKENKDLSSFLLKHKTKILIIAAKSDNIEDDALTIGRSSGVDIVIWKSPTQTRIEVGSKLEGNLPDILTSNIVKDNMKLIGQKKYFEFFKTICTKFYEKTEEVKAEYKDLGDFLLEHPLILLVIAVGWLILLFICPEYALFFLFFLVSKKDGYSGKGDFSGGGSSEDDK